MKFEVLAAKHMLQHAERMLSRLYRSGRLDPKTYRKVLRTVGRADKQFRQAARR